MRRWIKPAVYVFLWQVTVFTVMISEPADSLTNKAAINDVDGQSDPSDNRLEDFGSDRKHAAGGGAGGGLDSCFCGDADGNGFINISDAMVMIYYIFGGGPAPDPLCLGDADGNNIVGISDSVYIIAYIFGGGPEPHCP